MSPNKGGEWKREPTSQLQRAVPRASLEKGGTAGAADDDSSYRSHPDSSYRNDPESCLVAGGVEGVTAARLLQE